MSTEDELNASLLDVPFVVENDTFQANFTESVPYLALIHINYA